MGFGLFLSSWTPFAELARQTAGYRALLAETPEALRANPAAATSTWRAGSMSRKAMPRRSARAKPASCAALRISPAVTPPAISAPSRRTSAPPRDYDALNRDIIMHGSPATVIEKIEELHAMAGNASVMLHFPPWYGAEKALASLELFAGEVIPKFRQTPVPKSSPKFRCYYGAVNGPASFARKA